MASPMHQCKLDLQTNKGLESDWLIEAPDMPTQKTTQILSILTSLFPLVVFQSYYKKHSLPPTTS